MIRLLITRADVPRAPVKVRPQRNPGPYLFKRPMQAKRPHWSKAKALLWYDKRHGRTVGQLGREARSTAIGGSSRQMSRVYSIHMKKAAGEHPAAHRAQKWLGNEIAAQPRYGDFIHGVPILWSRRKLFHEGTTRLLRARHNGLGIVIGPLALS
jgi:hypothetical protein